MTEIIHLDLTGDPAKIPQVFGAATDAILAVPRSTILFDLGRHAVDPSLLGKMLRWARRNEVLLRTRTRVQFLVIPRFWHRIQWRLAMLLDRPVVPSVIVRSRAGAMAWLARHGDL
jgi:hypothetical protein